MWGCSFNIFTLVCGWYVCMFICKEFCFSLMLYCDFVCVIRSVCFFVNLFFCWSVCLHEMMMLEKMTAIEAEYLLYFIRYSQLRHSFLTCIIYADVILTLGNVTIVITDINCRALPIQHVSILVFLPATYIVLISPRKPWLCITLTLLLRGFWIAREDWWPTLLLLADRSVRWY